MDAVTLDGLLGEMVPRLLGRYLGRPRLAGPAAIEFEVSAEREHSLWLDAGRGTAGIYWMRRPKARALEKLGDPESSGRARHALLSFRKHADGVRIHGVRRVAGGRTVIVDAGEVALVLRLGGSAPSLTLAVEGRPLAVLGDGGEVWPPPEDRPDSEWEFLVPESLVATSERARASGASSVRAVLDLVPGLGPRLAREVDRGLDSTKVLLQRLRTPHPTLLCPAPPDEWNDAALAPSSALALVPCILPNDQGVAESFGSWIGAAEMFLEGRRRGAAFDARRRSCLEAERRDIRRVSQLLSHLEKDVQGLADESTLRHKGEAILASLAEVPRGATVVVVPDPRDPERRLEVALDPRLSPAANADRFFERARRVERARRSIALRRSEARGRLGSATAREQAILAARNLGDLPAPSEPQKPQNPQKSDPRSHEPAGGSKPLHFLTSRGLSVLVGRSARENHELTFGVARPEDHWFHAQDVPGGHVILRDREGRATPDDFREAAEIAAHYSDARAEAAVDVHLTRRKHLRPGRGGPGRVVVGHAETLRVSPRNPEGRLRRR